ncbi:glycosyltransferase family 4 protein [Aciditerrimonas ferrireducens]|uniref:glycosyltransferase family 4 protein n=1 Tax=Aciditerrimonas ferrireducens TaxID=667306 RepID=UPI0020050ABB|nr:glycosyltransferase family 4 protein [Aciditerrimonas ferrireducens]MCK4178259.1 glycosyltransferase family 4 protein [Aciditerrimonas ferrireducens]
MRLDQVIPSLASRDAIGQHTLAIRDALRAAGLQSEIFYGTATPDVAGEGRPIGQMGRPAPGRWLLYQLSIGSPVFDVLMARPEPKLANYHNITPVDLLEPWEPAVGYELRLGRVQMARLARHCRLAVADSRFNEQELQRVGYRRTAVVPLLIDMARKAPAPDPATKRRLADQRHGGGIDLLFVGKLSPHKAPHDLVKVLWVLRRLYDPRARLHLVGSPLGSRYEPALRAFVEDLGLQEAVDFAGSVPEDVLEAYYQAADVFVCASDHEGFCVPVVEALGHGLPVVAFAAGAVPETVGDAGLVLPTKDPAVFAAAVHRVATDPLLRRSLVELGRQRAARYDLTAATKAMVEALTGALERDRPAAQLAPRR